MSARTLLISSMFLLLVAPPQLFGQDVSSPEVANEKFQLAGEINAKNVYVRSGASENFYPTMMLDKGVKITAVGEKFEWLKIMPPEGSFSYVAKVYVERRGNGSIGRVTKPDVLIRAGSTLNAMKTAVQTKLDENTDVTIIGEQDEYFKIKPPKDAYVYVKKEFVTLKAVEKDAAGALVDNTKRSTPAPAPADPAAQGDTGTQAAVPTTQSTDEAMAPATQPASAAAELAFDQVEGEFLTVSKQPLEQQPVADLLGRYRELKKNNDLPASMRRIAEHREHTLQIRSEALAELLKAKKSDEEAQQRTLAMKAERDELEQRIKQQEIHLYTAIGTLRTSSLQAGKDVLYRLTDPATGRTLVYVRSDAKLAQMIGQFVGVRGQLTTDSQMNIKVIAPKSVEAVEAAQVPAKVTAQIMPASMMPKASSASTSE